MTYYLTHEYKYTGLIGKKIFKVIFKIKVTFNLKGWEEEIYLGYWKNGLLLLVMKDKVSKIFNSPIQNVKYYKV